MSTEGTEPIEFREDAWVVRGGGSTLSFQDLHTIDYDLATFVCVLRSESVNRVRLLEAARGAEVVLADVHALIELFENAYARPPSVGETRSWASEIGELNLRLRPTDGRGHFVLHAEIEHRAGEHDYQSRASICVSIETEGLKRAATGLRPFFGPWAYPA